MQECSESEQRWSYWLKDSVSCDPVSRLLVVGFEMLETWHRQLMRA
jgi:hypothetical protein